MLRRFGRWYVARFRENWPNGVAILVFFFVSEVLDDENGDKSVAALIVSVVIALAVLLVIRWVRNDPGRDVEERPSVDR